MENPPVSPTPRSPPSPPPPQHSVGEVMGANNVDETDCENLFDQIDDLIPLDDNVVGGGRLVGSINGHGFPSWNDALADCDPFILSGHVNSGPGFSVQLSGPYEDIMQREWLSTFVEDSFSNEGKKEAEKESLITPSPNQFQISSPLSVLESTASSSSSAGGKTMQRARSKRPRPATFKPRPVIKLLPPSSSVNKKMMREFTEEPPAGGGQARKCLHCQITKTPQWRGGPLGPKTLCNACGIRFNTGRLFPEYRPAASPSSVPFLHSNSHKKVVEMRSKFGPEEAGEEEMHIGDPEVVNA